MPTTAYKGWTLPTQGGNVDTWGTDLNNNPFTDADTNLGGIVSKSLSSSNISLSAAEAKNAILRLSGTLTANVQVTSAAQGFYFVENLTSGAFTVTLTNGVAGVVIPQGRRVLVIADTTNGCRLGVTSFETGTRIPFQQTSAPTGWTKVTDAAYNDAAFRMTTGSASTGGSTAFTSVMTARTIARANLPNDTITTTTNGAHTHTVDNVFTSTAVIVSAGGGPIGSFQTLTTSSNGDHTHTIALNGGVTQTTMDFAIKYVDFCLASAD